MMTEELLTWKQARIGGIVTEAGSAAAYPTGTWRSLRPVHDMEHCTHCMICWVYCPDMAVVVEDGRFVSFDLDHCKGCGICAETCPVKVKEPHAVTGEMGKVIQMITEIE